MTDLGADELTVPEDEDLDEPGIGDENMGNIWSREPAIIIGAVVTVGLNLVASLAGEGFLTDIAAGRITDLINGAAGLGVAILPLITAYLIRRKVSPA